MVAKWMENGNGREGLLKENDLLIQGIIECYLHRPLHLWIGP
jgi:hypothetical protein